MTNEEIKKLQDKIKDIRQKDKASKLILSPTD
ncbi:unnamed protein product, partial [marine sediment metagenome]